MSRAFFVPLQGRSEWKNLSNDHQTRDQQLNQLVGGYYEFIAVPNCERIVMVLNDERELRGMRQNKHIKSVSAEGPLVVMKLDEQGLQAELTTADLELFKFHTEFEDK